MYSGPAKPIIRGISAKGKSLSFKGKAGNAPVAKLGGQSLSGKMKKNKKDDDAPATFSGTLKRKKSGSGGTASYTGGGGSMLNSSYSSEKDLHRSDILDIIEDRNEDTLEKTFLEILRLRVKRFLAYSLFGVVYEWSLHVLSLVSCILFIYQTYLPVSSTKDITTLNYLDAIEYITTVIFTFDFLLSLFIADHRWEYLRRYGIYEYKCELLLIMFNVFVR